MPEPIDLATFRRAMEIFAEELRRHREEIDSLNVYPVPDGDTGTNMLLTQEAVVAALAETARDGVSVRELGNVISRASLMGARGNSGVILSQILRGICERLPEEGTFEPGDLAIALEHAAEEAHRAVARPAEGTVLSVIRDAARAATDVARSHEGDGVASVIAAALEEAHRSLERTTELLPELKRAGVVDAGGKGIVLLLDALHAAVMGRAPSEPVGPLGPAGQPSTDTVGAAVDLTHEVQYLLEADDADVGSLRRALGEIGDSLVVVGGGGLYSVHVHTNDPRRAVEAGSLAGRTRDVRIADLRDAVTACIGGQARAVRVAEQECAMVAVAEGEGLERTFRSLGAIVVVGGPGNDPSVADLVAGLEAAPADGVVVLASHRSIATSAERAAELSSKDARFILTASLPASLTAAASFNPLASLADNAKAMKEAAAACRSGKLARAERDADTRAGPVKRGDWLGVADGEIVAAGSGVAAIAGEVVRRLGSDTAEVITLLVGSEAGSDDRRSVEGALRDSFPGLQVDVVDGGHPRHPFLIGVE